MIKQLSYSVTFPTNGVKLHDNVSFQPGVTAVVGDNGSGKTFGSIEMVRYLLFGKKALRGPASDYKTLEATGQFTIAGKDYTVERSKKGEKIVSDADEILAVGAEAVSAKCVELLGYGLDVFDVINASVQKQSDKLTQMAPTARKRLIDEVIGLASNEAVEKACKEEAKMLRREADVLQENLVKPEQPVRPDKYRMSSEIAEDLKKAKALAAERNELERRAYSYPGPVEVVEKPEGELEALVEEVANYQALALKHKHAEVTLAHIPEARFSEAELRINEAWLDFEDWSRRAGPMPAMSRAEAESVVLEWSHYDAVKKIGDVEVDCPKCRHSFAPGHAATPPTVSREDAKTALQAYDCGWDDPMEEPEQIGDGLNRAEVAKWRSALERAEEREALLTIVNAPLPVDRSNELKPLQAQWAAYNAYCKHLDWAEAEEVKRAEAELQLSQLPTLTTSVEDLDKAYVDARVYETQIADHDRLAKAYNETSERIAERARMSEEFKKGAKALVHARTEVKAYLSPSLSRVSTSLIHQMSGGVFSAMIVDEDMNVTVDGQDIATLSGAGSTVANLALRLALGQVLANNVFPVFIADEADADLSESRARFTVECLSNLKDKLSQIIMITHKDVDLADHTITR